MARYLVTGTGGFIGSHVALALLERGHDVTGVDDFNDYYPAELKRRRHARLEAHRSYDWYELDLSHRDRAEALVTDGGFDVVIHLAAQPGVRYSLTHPHDYISRNITAFLHILEGCRHSRSVPRLVYASSSSVYGGLRELPFSESLKIDRPISLYAATKAADELLAYTYSHLYGIQAVGLRFFTVCGPWSRPDMMSWIFTEAIVNGQAIRLFAQGKNRRSFTDISDIVSGVLSCCTTDSLGKHETINLGNDRSLSVLEVVDMLEDIIGRKAERVLLPPQPGDMEATLPDMDKAARLLGFRPSVDFRTCLENFVRWYFDHPHLAELVRKWRSGM